MFKSVESFPSRSLAATTGVLLALVCFIALVACHRSSQIVDALVSDCGLANKYLQASVSIQSPDDANEAFEASGLERPSDVRTALDAKVFFARASIDQGCEWKTHAGVILGGLLLQRGEAKEAVGFLEKSVANSETLDGYELLARAYNTLGEGQKANQAREKAESLKGEWD